MTKLTYKLKYEFDWSDEIGGVVFWNCGTPIGGIRRKKVTNGTC